MDRRKFLKMLLKGTCNLLFFSSVAFLLVLVGESSFFHVLAQMTETNDDQVILKTVDAGSFIGQRKPLSEAVLKPNDPNELPRSYFSFRGIPYARPPVGVELRWKEPQPLEILRQPKVTTEFKPVCSQWDSVKRKVIGGQDCLYLNAYTPYVPSSIKRPPLVENTTSWTVENRNLLPVLIYFPGGESISSSGNLYGPERFMKENVVLVTVSYRLGIFGFLSNGKSSLPGNYGLLDQIQALRWVQQNIYRFGGNPLRVAIFGNVEYLLLTPRAKGLFQGAIITPVSTSMFKPVLKKSQNLNEITLKIANGAGCPTNNENEMIECLKLLDVDRLIRIQQRLLKFFSYPECFGPIVDKEWVEYPLLPDDPQVLLNEGRFTNNIPIMVGSSAYEGFNPFLEFYAKFGPDRENLLKDEEFVKERLGSTLKIILGVEEEEAGFERIFESVWRYYFDGLGKESWEKESNRNLWKLFRIFGDLTMHSGHRKLVQLISAKAKAPVFNYVFNHSIENFSTYLKESLLALGNKERDPDRSIHTVNIPPWKELYYLFEPLDFENSIWNRQNNKPRNQSRIVKNGNNGNLSSESVEKKIFLNTNKSTARNFTKEDEKLSEFLIKLWITFANYGSPKQIIAKMGNHTRWQRVTEDKLNYYVLGESSHPMKSDFRKAETQFWTSILPQIQELSEKITELGPFPLLFWIFLGLTSLLVFISFVLLFCICCSKDSKDKRFGEDNLVFLKRIPAD